MKRRKENEKRLKRLLPLLREAKYVLIVMQDHPDPDAIGSDAALRALTNAVGSGQCSLVSGAPCRRAKRGSEIDGFALPDDFFRFPLHATGEQTTNLPASRRTSVV